jgi:hypothetical protein
MVEDLMNDAQSALNKYNKNLNKLSFIGSKFMKNTAKILFKKFFIDHGTKCITKKFSLLDIRILEIIIRLLGIGTLLTSF